MGNDTSIEWTDATWNPIRGCSRVSEGCRHCYAETVAARFSGKGLPYEGLAKRVRISRPVIQGGAVFDPNGNALKRDEYGDIAVDVGEIVTHEARWTGEVRLIEKHLADPIRWTKPRRIFVNSMSDLFHEKVPDEWIDRIFAVMAMSPQHTFQVLTKRPERMREYQRSYVHRVETEGVGIQIPDCVLARLKGRTFMPELAWPLPNVWLGVSVENQATADERIPILLDTLAALRFISAEPLLGAVNLRPFLHRDSNVLRCTSCRYFTNRPEEACPNGCGHLGPDVGIDWTIVGGESGNGARPCETEWIRGIVKQCQRARVACFVKQLGGFPQVRERGEHEEPFEPQCEWPKGTTFAGGNGPNFACLHSSKGGDMDEWPEYLRVREFPRLAVVT